MTPPPVDPLPAVARERLRAIASEHEHPLLFATVSGAHLYGFASPDSDFDLRGVHILPAREVLGLLPLRETIEVSRMEPGLELDLVTHDARKFFELLLRRNGYVLEQLLSPLVIVTTPAHAELVSLAPACITRHHAHHYLGFAETQRRLVEKEEPPRVKPLLYLYRVLLTGIHLMRTGEVEANLPRLNETFRLPQVPDLVARKVAGAEASLLESGDLAFHKGECARLRAMLEDAARESALPDAPTALPALSALLSRIRLQQAGLTPEA